MSIPTRQHAGIGRRGKTVDVVVMAAVGDAIGPIKQTIRLIRRYAKRGGCVVIADDYVKEGRSNDFSQDKSCLSRDETLSLLTAHGDVGVDDSIEATDETDFADQMQMIHRGAARVQGRHPELAAELKSP
jgi:hypothetical protein